MADVGDRHHQPEAAAAKRLAVHRVVEVARRLAVDGDERQVANVIASGQVFFQHLAWQLGRLRLDLRREDIGQVVLPQRDLDFHAGAGKAAQHFGYPSHRLVVRAGLGEDFHRHHLAGLRGAGMLGGDEDVLVDAAVFRDQEADATFKVVAADDEPVDVLQHFDDFGLTPPAPVEAGNANQHAVAVQHPVHLLGRQIEIVATFFRHHETEAVGVPLDAALDEVEFVWQAQLALAVEHQLAVALHRTETALEQVAFGLGDFQLLGEGVGVDRTARLGQQLEDVFAARQRRFVALDLTLVERIGETDFRKRVLACTAAGFF